MLLYIVDAAVEVGACDSTMPLYQVRRTSMPTDNKVDTHIYGSGAQPPKLVVIYHHHHHTTGGGQLEGVRACLRAHTYTHTPNLPFYSTTPMYAQPGPNHSPLPSLLTTREPSSPLSMNACIAATKAYRLPLREANIRGTQPPLSFVVSSLIT